MHATGTVLLRGGFDGFKVGRLFCHNRVLYPDIPFFLGWLCDDFRRCVEFSLFFIYLEEHTTTNIFVLNSTFDRNRRIIITRLFSYSLL